MEEFEIRRTLKHLQRATAATETFNDLSSAAFPGLSDAARAKLPLLIKQLQETSTALKPILGQIETLLGERVASTGEVRRQPTEYEPAKISVSRILVCPKRSRFELDMERMQLSEREMLEYYANKRIDAQTIHQSHIRQGKAYQEFQAIFPAENIVRREEVLAAVAASSVDLVISLGGDDHFTFLSHFLKDTFVLGVTSDPVKSEGALLAHMPEDIGRILGKLERGDFLIEDWTRLECHLNGEPIQRCTGTYFIGDLRRLNMSKYKLTHGATQEEQKGSGLLIASGTGSSGWYNSEIGELFLGGDRFPRTSNWARFGATGIYHGRVSGHTLPYGTLKAGEEILVESLHDTDGIIGVDSVEQYRFQRGDRATIRVSNTPLKVLWPAS